jgi:proteasome accessory factor B
MRAVRLTKTGFRRPPNFSISKVLSGSFGVFEGGKKHRIKLQFDAFAARLVSERTWHESQKFREAKDGTATLELELGGLEEIQRWVLSWGSHVRVLAPDDLIAQVREEAEKVRAIYA